MLLKFGRQHGHRTLAQLGRLLASEFFKRLLSKRQQFRNVVGGLGESAVAYLVIDLL
jgi:hypothetical protein